MACSVASACRAAAGALGRPAGAVAVSSLVSASARRDPFEDHLRPDRVRARMNEAVLPSVSPTTRGRTPRLAARATRLIRGSATREVCPATSVQLPVRLRCDSMARKELC